MLCQQHFTVGCFPFYRAILGFLGYHWFPPFVPLGTRTNVVPTTLVASPFLIPHYFLLLGFLPQKHLANFPFWGVLKELTFGPSSFKASKSHIFKLNFWLFLPLSFFLSELIPSLPGWRFSQLLHFMVLLLGFPEVPTLCSWIVVLQAFGWLRGTYLSFVPCVSWHSF